MPIRKTDPNAFAEKWNRRLKSAIPDIRKGVEAVTESPMEKAAANKDKMKNKLIEAIDSGKWESRLKAVSLDEWKKKLIEKGLPAISTGADLAKPKVADFAGQLLDYEKSIIGEIDRMPTVTLDDSIRKMEAWARAMNKFKYNPRK